MRQRFLHGLSGPAKAFVFFCAAVLVSVVALAAYAVFFLSGQIRSMLIVFLGAAALIACFWVQLWFRRAFRDAYPKESAIERTTRETLMTQEAWKKRGR